MPHGVSRRPRGRYRRIKYRPRARFMGVMEVYCPHCRSLIRAQIDRSTSRIRCARSECRATFGIGLRLIVFRASGMNRARLPRLPMDYVFVAPPTDTPPHEDGDEGAHFMTHDPPVVDVWLLGEFRGQREGEHEVLPPAEVEFEQVVGRDPYHRVAVVEVDAEQEEIDAWLEQDLAEDEDGVEE